MAGRGPAPSKDRSQRVRPGKSVVPTTVIASDDQLRGPDLPDDALDEPWHSRTLAWWKTWRESPQAQAFTATDWDFLLDTALMHHTMWSKGRWEFASELRLRAAKFGATPEDRARLRIQVTAEAPAKAEEKPPSRYGHLRAVKEA
jgi:hypothetical protein